MPQIQRPNRTELNTRQQVRPSGKAVKFSVDPLAPLSVEPESPITHDNWLPAQLEEPERWDGMS